MMTTIPPTPLPGKGVTVVRPLKRPPNCWLVPPWVGPAEAL